MIEYNLSIQWKECLKSWWFEETRFYHSTLLLHLLCLLHQQDPFLFIEAVPVVPLVPEDCDQEKTALFLFWLMDGSRLLCCNIAFIFWEKSSWWQIELKY